MEPGTLSRALTLEDVAHYPAPGMNYPQDARFSPDGRTVTYLYSTGHTLTRELWALDRESGREFRVVDPAGGGTSDATVSREEALRRERQRQLAGGVTSYAWSERGDTLLVPMQGELFIRHRAGGALTPTRSGPGCIDPRLNADGSAVAFVRDGELYALDLTTADAEPLRLTFDASPADEYGDRAVTNGLAEFVAQEEMGRAAGFWWSPDGASIAFEQADASAVPRYFISHPGTESVDVEAHRYPFAGAANVAVKLGVVPAVGGDVRWLPLGDDADIYLARVTWTPDCLLLVQIESRDQTRVDVRRIDPATGESRTLWVEEVQPWVNLHDDLRYIRRDGAATDDYTILWSSERTGRRELYLYDRDGALLRQVSRGDAHIDAVRALDAAGGWVYVEGWRDSPLERHLYRVPLAGGPAESVTREPGTHATVLAPDCSAFIDVSSSASAPPSVSLRSISGEPLATLQAEAAPDERIGALALRPPQFVTLSSRDGETLHGCIYRPAEVARGARLPVIVSLYGGPHVQLVNDQWSTTARLRSQYLADQGFIVLTLDNRGSARRGLAFEGAVNRNMGDLEVQDQVDGVRWLAANVPEADTTRVGVYGWSYGGYMTLMCLARAPEVFKVGVAGAPVTAWDGYDTHYTERYMATPQTNPEGYRAASVMTHAARIRGKLLLVHGMIDENVHFRHTGRLLTALITQGIPHEVMLFPEERHSPRREQDRVAMERRIVEFFRVHL